ncbi:MAG: hypothetical protein II488_03520 [Firmicutes bacterium]|nr:hypothetical protein [Bacillota bacterium]MBQ4372310.1 hypothetical protein [Bacillota bacterium]
MEIDTFLLLAAAVLMLTSFGVQYLLLERCASRALRALPWMMPLSLAVLAVCSLVFHWGGGGWLDLSALFALVLGAGAVCCAASIGLAHLVHFLVKRAQEE